MSSKDESSKRKKRRHEEPDNKEMIEKCLYLLELHSPRASRRSRRSRNSSGKENSNPHKKSRKSRQSDRPETPEISEELACSSRSRDSRTERNRQKSAEDKMADIASALSGAQTAATAAPPADAPRSENSSFVDEWQRIVRAGLDAGEVAEIAAKYRTSEESVKELRAPELNAEVRSIVDSATLRIDESYAARQNQAAVQLSVIDGVLGLIAERAKQSTEVARLVEYLHDFGRNNADIHHEISLARRYAIFSSLNVKDVEAAEIRCEVGDKLFTRSMEMLLYKQRVRADVEEAVKPIVASLKEDFEKIVKTVAANWETGFFERLHEMADQLKKDLAPAQNALVAPLVEELAAEAGTESGGASLVAAKIEGARLAKIEGARSAKVEAASGTDVTCVPSEREIYPGGDEVVKRASELRGVPNKYATLTESTRKSYGRFIRNWWYFCQSKQKDVFQPSASDVIEFYCEQARVTSAMDLCKRAMGHIMPERIVMNPNVILTLRNIKKEPR